MFWHTPLWWPSSLKACSSPLLPSIHPRAYRSPYPVLSWFRFLWQQLGSGSQLEERSEIRGVEYKRSHRQREREREGERERERWRERWRWRERERRIDGTDAISEVMVDVSRNLNNSLDLFIVHVISLSHLFWRWSPRLVHCLQCQPSPHLTY